MPQPCGGNKVYVLCPNAVCEATVRETKLGERHRCGGQCPKGCTTSFIWGIMVHIQVALVNTFISEELLVLSAPWARTNNSTSVGVWDHTRRPNQQPRPAPLGKHAHIHHEAHALRGRRQALPEWMA